MRTKVDARPGGNPGRAQNFDRQEERKRIAARGEAQVASIKTRGGRRHVRFFRGKSGWLVFVASASGLTLVGGFFRLKKLAVAAAKRLAEEGLPPQPQKRSHRDAGGRYACRP